MIIFFHVLSHLYLLLYIARSSIAKDFLIDDFEDDTLKQQEAAAEEAKHLKKLAEIKLYSPRLEKARKSPKAKAFFSRPPNEIEGFELMWASAIGKFPKIVSINRV